MISLNWIIGILVAGFISWAFYSNRKNKYSKAREIKEEITEEQNKWLESNQLSYGQIQDRKFALTKYVKETIIDDSFDKKQLLELIDDWADLQVKSFEDRRSWVRKPKEN